MQVGLKELTEAILQRQPLLTSLNGIQLNAGGRSFDKDPKGLSQMLFEPLGTYMLAAMINIRYVRILDLTGGPPLKP